MKPLYECYDITLRKLVKDWDNHEDDRIDLKSEELLTSFDLTGQFRKHEFFKRLIKKLVFDGYAQHKDNREFIWADLDDFQKNTIITLEGYYFITEQNGYTGEKNQQDIAISKQDAYDKRMEKSTSDLAKWTKCLFWGTVFVGVATLALVITEISKTH